MISFTPLVGSSFLWVGFPHVGPRSIRDATQSLHQQKENTGLLFSFIHSGSSQRQCGTIEIKSYMEQLQQKLHPYFYLQFRTRSRSIMRLIATCLVMYSLVMSNSFYNDPWKSNY
jgi:hypothetical protein